MAGAPVLSYWERNAPVGVMAAAGLAGVEITYTPDPKATKDTKPSLQFASGEELQGVAYALKFIARSSSSSTDLYGENALSSCQVDQWLDVASSIVSGAGLDAMCASLNEYLTFRTFFVGYSLTIADLCVWGQLQGALMWKKVRATGTVPHLCRWFDYCSQLPACAGALKAGDSKRKVVEDAHAGTAKQAADGGGSFDIGLPNAEVGKVVTRFPPEPSGYLHIGHAKAALMNQHFAELYKGRLLVRFDDTNPSKEKDEYVENIVKDIADLGLKYEKITYTSDYFDQMVDLATKMVEAGMLYADDTPAEQMKEERMHGIESKCRKRPASETLALFKEMQAGSEKGLTHCLRVKMDMAALNKALRDPVVFRCNLTPHWRTGTKWKAYPTYDFACPFVDSLEGVTHALRSSEYRDREALYYWMLRLQQQIRPDLPHVNMWDFSRLNFVNTLLSKRKLTWFVDNGLVAGWNDPRMPTVQGVLRRGMTIEALKRFILSQGASKNITLQEWDKIWTMNKQIIDPVCPRHTAVVADVAVPLQLEGAPAATELLTVPRHKKHPGAGQKVLYRRSELWLEGADAAELAEGEEVTLMDWGNAVVTSLSRDASGAVTGVRARLHLEGDVKATKRKLTWLARGGDVDLVDLTLVDFDYLITKKKIEEDDDWQSLVNRNSRWETRAWGDPNMRTLQRGDIIQLERKGYFRVDEPLVRAGRPLVLFAIPDGRTKNMTKA